ncbi:MAG: class I SAM-dependent methyltransferase [Chitinophagaceae bacterium]
MPVNQMPMDPNTQSINTYNQVAELYQERFMDLTLYDETYDAFCQLLPVRNASILEIGCGPGNITRFLQARMPESHIIAIDAAPNMITLARKNVLGVDFRVMDARSLKGILPGLDGIICGFCMPYLTHETAAQLISDCLALLKSGGVFYASVIEGAQGRSFFQQSSDGKTGAWIFYYEEHWFKEQFNKNECTALKTRRIVFERKNGEKEVHLVVMAMKK